MKEGKIVVYDSISLYSRGIRYLIFDMVSSVWKSRELIYRLFLRNFVVRYKQSLINWGWIFLMPFITMLTFLLLNISGILKIGDLKVPYPIYGMLGVSLWNLFSNGLPSTTLSVDSLGGLIGKINFPKSAIIFAASGQVLVDFYIRMLVILPVFLIYMRFPSWLIILFPIYIMPLVLLMLGCGFFFAIVQVIFKDTQHIINLGLSFFLFLMPIMYDMPKKGLLVVLSRYNPIYYLISVPRDLIIFGTTNNFIPYFLSTLISLFIFTIGWFVFYLSETKLAERI